MKYRPGPTAMALSGILALVFMLHFPVPLHAASEAPTTLRPEQAPSSAAKAKKTAPVPRRRVPAITPTAPAVPSTTTQTTVLRQPATSMPRPVPSVQEDRPAAVTGCDPGGCWDASGNRYNSGAGSTYMNNAGKLCTRSGAWMQCF